MIFEIFENLLLNFSLILYLSFVERQVVCFKCCLLRYSRHVEVWKNLCIFPAQASLEPVTERLFSVLFLGVCLLEQQGSFPFVLLECVCH